MRIEKRCLFASSVKSRGFFLVENENHGGWESGNGYGSGDGRGRQLIGRVKTEEHQKNYEIIERVDYT
ncbi:hypothetical protein B5E84_06535 [Lachnoclostridium sp. An14]|uniref:hypothetical protein n=1 Tax=Lachnoclostridium sp. An14 TaxID=1965562 RepID=UPI000B3701B7|nr:hypothetical protein [Lachnoclostridium sp. An14]OUQ19419.1 hypothetical protein B5E84_06535 [Lachnoclostridium sp. An14]